MTLKIDAKFKEKLTCSFKYDRRSFYQTTQKSENFFSMGSFCTNYIRFKTQKGRRDIFHVNEQWCKIWINPDLVVLNMAWENEWTFIRALRALKTCTSGIKIKINLNFYFHNFFVVPQKVLWRPLRPLQNLLRHHKGIGKGRVN